MPEDEPYELIDGELVLKEAARGPHGRAQTKLGELLGPFHRRAGGPPDRPGGWWFAADVLVSFSEGQVRRPDVSGWRRERMPEMPEDPPIAVRPDWICEIVSPSRPSKDTISNMRLYHRAGVPHYWIVDPRDETLTVHRWGPEGFVHLLGAQRGERVRAEPFMEVELSVGALFGDDD